VALTEVTVAVAVTALLAAITAPNFMRAHLRSQASQTLKVLREIESAKEMYALKNGVSDGVVPTCADLLPYARPGSLAATQLAVNRVHDVLGRSIAINAIGKPVQLNTVSWDQFEPVVGDSPQAFWGEFGHY
jgi:type II secretory pathway pseudopilin PulG